MNPTPVDISVFEDIKKVFCGCKFSIANSGQNGDYLFLSSRISSGSGFFNEDVSVRYNLKKKHIKVSRVFLEPVSPEKVNDLLIILNFINCFLLTGHFYFSLESGYVTSQHGMFVTGNQLNKSEFEVVLKQLFIIALSNYPLLKAFLQNRITKDQCLHDIILSMQLNGGI